MTEPSPSAPTDGDLLVAGDLVVAGDCTENSPEQLVEDDLLIEDVSIDGMCGVY
jgi:mycofactocin precursor